MMCREECFCLCMRAWVHKQGISLSRINSGNPLVIHVISVMLDAPEPQTDADGAVDLLDVGGG